MDERTKELLAKAARLLEEPNPDILAKAEPFKREYENVLLSAVRAQGRMERQKASGDHDKAALSRRAYKYCIQYGKKLQEIIKGIEAQADRSRVTIFTKQSKKRYLHEDYLEGLEDWDKNNH